jgi:hypothetical protein
MSLATDKPLELFRNLAPQVHEEQPFCDTGFTIIISLMYKKNFKEIDGAKKLESRMLNC